jgi:hypothetical protein
VASVGAPEASAIGDRTRKQTAESAGQLTRQKLHIRDPLLETTPSTWVRCQL